MAPDVVVFASCGVAVSGPARIAMAASEAITTRFIPSSHIPESGPSIFRFQAFDLQIRATGLTQVGRATNPIHCVHGVHSVEPVVSDVFGKYPYANFHSQSSC